MDVVGVRRRMKKEDQTQRFLRVYLVLPFSAPPRLASGYNLCFRKSCAIAAQPVSEIWIQALAVIRQQVQTAIRAWRRPSFNIARLHTQTPRRA